MSLDRDMAHLLEVWQYETPGERVREIGPALMTALHRGESIPASVLDEALRNDAFKLSWGTNTSGNVVVREDCGVCGFAGYHPYHLGQLTCTECKSTKVVGAWPFLREMLKAWNLFVPLVMLALVPIYLLRRAMGDADWRRRAG